MLRKGDVIRLGVTHQVVINGANSWIKLEIESSVAGDESSDQAFDRVNTELQSKVISAMESAAQTIIDYEKEGK